MLLKSTVWQHYLKCHFGRFYYSQYNHLGHFVLLLACLEDIAMHDWQGQFQCSATHYTLLRKSIRKSPVTSLVLNSYLIQSQL